MADYEQYISALFDSDAVWINAPENAFTLRNGRRSVLYVDHGLTMSEPTTRSPFMDALQSYIQTVFLPKTTILAQVDSKSSKEISAIQADRGVYRLILLNPASTTQNEKGTDLRIRFPQNMQSRDRIVVLDDVYTEDDTTALNVIEDIRREIGESHEMHLVVGLLRGNSASSIQKLAEHGVHLHYLITQNDILRRRWEGLDDEQKTLLEQEFGRVE